MDLSRFDVDLIDRNYSVLSTCIKEIAQTLDVLGLDSDTL